MASQDLFGAAQGAGAHAEKQPLITVKNLKLGVMNDDREVVFTIDYGTFDIYPRDFVLLKGRNGSGKSTFLRLFHLQSSDYFRFLEGEIVYRDEENGFPADNLKDVPPKELTRLNRLVSYIGQEEEFFSGDSAFSYIHKIGEIALEGMERREKAARLAMLDDLMQSYYEDFLQPSFKCDWQQFRKKSVNKWSGGQRKMINVFAGVLKAQVCGIKLLIMDEPLNNLDGANKYILNELIKKLRAGSDIAILMVTHCQIFEGIGKILTIKREEGRDRAFRAEFTDAVGAAGCHSECLENYAGGGEGAR